MSLAGVRSTRGDEYQLAVGLHWLIRLLEGEISAFQAESTGIPGDDRPILVDDIVVTMTDGSRTYLQVKKNAPNYGAWKISHSELRKELVKARRQLEDDPPGRVCFYSQSPFGQLQKLCDDCSMLPDYVSFAREAGSDSKNALETLSKMFERPHEKAFLLAKRIKFGAPKTFEEWDSENRSRIDRMVANAETAVPVLTRLLANHEAKLRGPKFELCREDVLRELENAHVYLSPPASEQSLVESFRSASAFGRHWVREIRGIRINRPEFGQIVDLVTAGARCILVSDHPGSGKTCLLLDLADHFETVQGFATLFIKGEWYAGARTEADLSEKGLPENLLGACSRLAKYRRVVVILDSLDVLSLDRSHTSLRLFLALIERVRAIPEVTVVVACREFDLQYDPLLRDTKWDHRIVLQRLSFEATVAPLLRQWGVDPDQLPPDLRELLRNPHQLSLFDRIVRKGISAKDIRPCDLHDLYITETISRADDLGPETASLLENAAEMLTRERTQRLARSRFGVDERVLQRLLSERILLESTPGYFAFAHQSLTEALVVRHELGQGNTLTDLIRSHAPLPFIRPVVRSFFFHLRSRDVTLFRRQVADVIDQDDIAYHLKRLLVDSLAEVVPDSDDWPLVRRVFTREPELFRRLLSRVSGSGWFAILTEYWLELARQDPNATSWLDALTRQLYRWLDSHPAQVIFLWTQAVTTGWCVDAAWPIGVGLLKLEAWDTPGIRGLLSALLRKGDVPDQLGRPLSRWVQATNTGDDLVWQFMTRGEKADGSRGRRSRVGLRVGDFASPGFLAERLKRSDALLDCAVDFVKRLASEGPNCEQSWARADLLYETTWRHRHTRYDVESGTELTVLVRAIELALKHRASLCGDWWRANEPRLRRSSDLGIRYILLMAYLANVDDSADAIEAQLVDQRLYDTTRLDDEIRTLTERAYHVLSEQAQDQHQALLLALCEPPEDEPVANGRYRVQRTYEFLLSVPCCLRSPESQSFLDNWESEFGRVRPASQIVAEGGGVSPPVSVDFIMNCIDGDLVRLLRHYEGVEGNESLSSGKRVGGYSQVRRIVEQGASLDPERFLAARKCFVDVGLGHLYELPVFLGVSHHVRVRTSRLQPEESWVPKQPLVPIETLAWEALRFVEDQLPRLRQFSARDTHDLARVVEGCANVAADDEYVERLTMALCRFLDAEDPVAGGDAGAHANDTVSVNSTRGVAAGSAATLYCCASEAGVCMPRLLPCLLHRFARDPVPGVRLSVLNQLPFIIQTEPGLGWRLLGDTFAERQHALWPEAERVLYFNCTEHFDRVAPYLERMREEAIDVAGQAYGRLMMLSHLAGHVSKRELSHRMEDVPEAVHEGVVQVLWANLADARHRKACRQGLLDAVARPDCSASVLEAIARGFGSKRSEEYVDADLVRRFLAHPSDPDKPPRLWGVCNWLEMRALHDPLAALDICERLVETLQRLPALGFAVDPKPLASALLQILREADEMDDRKMIGRAIRVQDALLRAGVSEFDELLDRAGRS
jgi:hypothetical protein